MFILFSIHLVPDKETGRLKEPIKQPFLKPSSLTDARLLQSDPSSKASASLFRIPRFSSILFPVEIFSPLRKSNVF